jgi:hypothetical protein
MSAEIERAIAEVLAGIEEDCLPKKPVLVPEPPAPRVVAREIKVVPGDPNYSPANQGRVEVSLYEQMYWSAVDRAFCRPLFAEVVSGYDPFARDRMPGFDPEDR